AETEAKRLNTTGAVAVVDDGGNLLYLLRIDNTFPAGSYVAMDKARTAATFRMPTRNLEDAVKNGRTSLVAVAEMTPLAGGVPIVIDAQCCSDRRRRWCKRRSQRATGRRTRQSRSCRNQVGDHAFIYCCNGRDRRRIRRSPCDSACWLESHLHPGRPGQGCLCQRRSLAQQRQLSSACEPTRRARAG